MRLLEGGGLAICRAELVRENRVLSPPAAAFRLKRTGLKKLVLCDQ